MAREGLSFDRSGQPWAVWSAKRKFPARAISFNHRAESYYRQQEKNSGNHYILQATRSGLRRVRMLAHRTPMFIIRYLVLWHNKEHGGSPNSVLDMGAEAIKLEAGWKAYAHKNGITTKDKEYEKKYWVWVQGQSKTFKSWREFESLKALVHTFEFYDIWDPLVEWMNNHVDFLDTRLEQGYIISTMHSLVVIISGYMRRFYPKWMTASMVFEAVKFCAPTLVCLLPSC